MIEFGPLFPHHDKEPPSLKPKILAIITRAEPGGAQSHLVELVSGLRQDYDFEVGCGEEEAMLDEFRRLGIPVTVYPTLTNGYSPYGNARAALDIWKHIGEVAPDIVHTHSTKAGFIGRFCAWLRGVRTVHTVHGWAFCGPAGLVMRIFATNMERLAALWSDRIIVVADDLRRSAIDRKICPSARMVRIWNGIGDLPAAGRPRNEVPVITMVARFSRPKDPLTVIKAAAAIKRSFELRFVGDGPGLAQAMALAQQLSIAGKVRFLGRRDDVAGLLGQSDVFVLSSYSEGLPISILEAMRAGLPVVATGVGGVPELVTTETGLTLPPGDVEALTRALDALLADDELRLRLGAGGRRRYLAHFDGAAMIRETGAVYDELVGSGAPAG